MLRNKHIAVLGRVVLILFVIASSGFTLALRICLMNSPDCCSTMCQDSAPSAKEASVGAQMGCPKSIVAGGLNTNPGLIEKSVKLQNGRYEVLSVTVLHPERYAQPQNQFGQFTSYSSSSSPPSVEKYVLYSSFLI